MAAVYDFVRAANRELDRGSGGGAVALEAFLRVMRVFDVLPTAKAVPEESAWVAEQVEAREKARKAKDFREADRIRAALRERGVEVEDTPQGPKWKAV
jgi:cysteinyl-tRNA synthetase